jgi:hypothetical protein
VSVDFLQVNAGTGRVPPDGSPVTVVNPGGVLVTLPGSQSLHYEALRIAAPERSICA